MRPAQRPSRGGFTRFVPNTATVSTPACSRNASVSGVFSSREGMVLTQQVSLSGTVNAWCPKLSSSRRVRSAKWFVTTLISSVRQVRTDKTGVRIPHAFIHDRHDVAPLHSACGQSSGAAYRHSSAPPASCSALLHASTGPRALIIPYATAARAEHTLSITGPLRRAPPRATKRGPTPRCGRRTSYSTPSKRTTKQGGRRQDIPIG